MSPQPSLNGTFEEEVYIAQPEDFVAKGEKHLVIQSKKECLWSQAITSLLEHRTGCSLQKKMDSPSPSMIHVFISNRQEEQCSIWGST